MFVKFKHKKDEKMFSQVALPLLLIFSDMANYAYEKHGVDIVVTDTVSTLADDIALGRKSDSHRTRRAIDFRTYDLDPFVLQDIINYIESKKEYKQYKYLSNSGEKRLVYVHDSGYGEHAHMQIHKRYSL